MWLFAILYQGFALLQIFLSLLGAKSLTALGGQGNVLNLKLQN